MTTLEAIGERKAIELVIKQFEKMPHMPIPFGDDVAAYPISPDQWLVLKTDMLVGKTDVPEGMSFWQAARKAVVMNVSDFAAKGVKPEALLVSLGMPRNMKKKDIEEIGRGLNAGAREYGAYIIGGDTGEASDLVISLSLFGRAKKKDIVLRSGAGRGDFVAVTGYFGKTSAGLKLLLSGLEAPKEIGRVLVDSVMMPYARLREGLALCRTGAVTASIDSSDGLAWSLHEIAKASEVGILVNRLPVAKEAENFARIHNLDLKNLVFHGGEEYELVVTVRAKLWSEAKQAVEREGGRLLQIGKVTSGAEVRFETDEERSIIEPRGYEHFAT